MSYSWWEGFDAQWWITDFGWSILFEPDSDPDERKVVGLFGAGSSVDISLKNYQKASYLYGSARSTSQAAEKTPAVFGSRSLETSTPALLPL